MPTPEAVKRLAPTRETLRELYLKSGNRCAYPGCVRAIINSKGNVVGQICHIEAAEPGGQRFNSAQTNEQRRHFSNLMLMCTDHHIETNDTKAFPVDRLRSIKRAHERKFEDVIGAIAATVVDHTTKSSPLPARTLASFCAALEITLADHEMREMVAELQDFAENLATIPLPAREFLTILVARSRRGDRDCRVVSPSEVQMATGLEDFQMRQFVGVLDRAGIVGEGDRDDLGNESVELRPLRSGWPVWSDLRKYCKKKDIQLAEVLENLNFALLDAD